ncbi:MAG: hypothetical protein A3F11_02900 [Gammaproteobacteria bacterium RIFCSPHIGHO2_12_FULL_37_14]|nr:MAG: hypothetical protein A3F11_02900 [Gammaproteobacteria bacterium RIFCSPHIGHO2_12_FULL_37_14]
MRKLLELISRKIVLKRHLPKQFGGDPIYVSPDSALRYWSYHVEKYDPLLFRICQEMVKPGFVVWDIGANIGLFTFASAYLSGSAGRVISIEPDMFCIDLLKRSLVAGYSKRAKIDILPIAISDTIGMSDFYIAKRGRATNFLSGTNGTTDSGGIREVHSVLTLTLDWLLNYLPPPDILKIDVECSEDRVLFGATNILRTIRPVILCETTEGPLRNMVNCFLKKDYVLYDIDSGLGQNIIALPKEQPPINYPLSIFMTY